MTAPQGGIPLTTEQAAAAATLNSAVSPFVAAYLETTGRKDIISDEFRKRLGFSLSAALVMAIDRLVDGDIEGLSMQDVQNMDATLADLIANSRDLDPNKPDPEPWVHTFIGEVPAGVMFERPSLRLPTGIDDHPDCECRYEPRVFPKPGDPDPTPTPDGRRQCWETNDQGYVCTWPEDFKHTIHVASANDGIIVAAWVK